MFKYQFILFLILLFIFYLNCFSLPEYPRISSSTTSKKLINSENISVGSENETLIILKSEERQNQDEDNDSSEPVEFLETLNGDKLVKGDKVIEVKTDWSTHLGDDDAEATE